MVRTPLPLVPPPPPREPIFSHVGIVGLGRLGLALGLAARRRWPSGLVIGVDANERLERAIRLHAVDVAAADLTILSGAGLVVLTGAPDPDAQIIDALPEYLSEPVVVTAAGGVGDAVLAAARRLPPRVAFVAGRLRATEASSSPAEPSGLPPLEGRWWTLAPPDASAPAAEGHRRLQAFLEGLGVRVTIDADLS